MKIDMSPQAIDTRLQRVSQLRALCLALAGPRLKRPWGVPEPPPEKARGKRQTADRRPQTADRNLKTAD